jgi:hypothetical protein
LLAAVAPALQQPRVEACGLGAMLDMNGDGNALDDILRLAGKALR